MPRFTPRTITGQTRFLEELRRVRARGFASDRQEKDLGAACIAAPVFDAHGVVGAISLSAPASHMDAKRVAQLAPALLEACAALSRHLGYQPRTALAEAAGRGPRTVRAASGRSR